MAGGLLVAAALLSGCAKHGRDDASASAAALVRKADAAWRKREEGFAEVEALLAEAYAQEARNPEVLWRLVRLHVAKGLAAEGDRERVSAFASARSLGLECLDADPVFQERRLQLGWENAIQGIPEERDRCVVWTAFAWVRWMEAMGPAATAIDLPAVDLFLEKANVSVEEDRDVLAWTAGVLAAIRTEGGRDLVAARSLLQLAIEAEPTEMARRADLVFLVGVPEGDRDLVAKQVAEAKRLQPVYPDDLTAFARLSAAE